MANKKSDPNYKVAAENRKAQHQYFIEDTVEAGIMLQGSEGELVDGLQYADENGDPTTTWMHPGTGPVPQDAMAAAIAVILEE